MTGFRSLALAAVSSAFLSLPAAAITLDFDSGTAIWQGGDPNSNTLIGYEIGGLSFGISLRAGTTAGASGANLFDTTACPFSGASSATTACGGTDDFDLVPNAASAGSGVAGNVLIRQEVNRSKDDDAATGGDIVFTLLSGPAFRILGFSAVDEQPMSILVDDVVLGTIDNPGNRDADSTEFALTPLISVGDDFIVRYAGSGGVDSIQLAPVPLPAGIALLLAGLGSLSVLRRRRGGRVTA